MPKQKMTKEEAYFIIGFFFIFGIVLIGLGYLWGLILVLLSFFLLMNIPWFRNLVIGFFQFFFSIAKELKRKPLPKREQLAKTPSPTELAVGEVNELIDVIQNFQVIRPIVGKKIEKKLQQRFAGYLSGTKYRDRVREEAPIGNSRIDFQIGRIGIELKYAPNIEELHRLFGQVENYMRSGILDYVIVVIYKEQSKESTIDFENRIKPYDWGQRVFVLSIF